MPKKQEPIQEPLFKGIDVGGLRDVETVSEDKAERFTFETVDFSDVNRPKTCLEVDFPILRVNEISNIEGSATKPIYMMSKWWARRRSSVFRQLLIAAAMKAPKKAGDAAQASWALMYRKSHQKHGKFAPLKVVDIFMGGGTTVVEAARLGFKVTGVDINPIAWWIVKNETSPVPPEQIDTFARYIESVVKPQIMPFFIAKSPRGFHGRWVEDKTGKPTSDNPLALKPEKRAAYRWEGPEVIYTFWVKHIMCADPNCSHLTPQVNSAIIAEKALKVKTWRNCVCPKCGEAFDLESGDFRMAPAATFHIGENEEPFTAIDVQKHTAKCPHCKKVLDADWVVSQERRKGKPIGKEITHSLLLSKDWLKGITAKAKNHYGGYHGASEEQDDHWFADRAKGLSLVEVRGTIPTRFEHSNFAQKKSEEDEESVSSGNIMCGRCGRVQDPTSSINTSGHLAPMFPYAIHGIDPAVKEKKMPYGGRFFDVPDVGQISAAIKELASRKSLKQWVPTSEIPVGCETHQRKNLPAHRYTRWYQMFNPRQLYVHSLLLDTISNASTDVVTNEVKSHALGAFQNYLRNNCSFSFWNPQRDTPEPFFSNNNFHPKATSVENGVFSDLGRGNFSSCIANVREGICFTSKPYDLRIASDTENGKSAKVESDDSILSKNVTLICNSSTDLHKLVPSDSVDLVITDPPFGGNVNYAEMADFFLAWLFKPLSKIFPAEFISAESPKTLEAVENSTRNPGVTEAGINKAAHVYYRLLKGCWKEANRILKPAGTLAFTFHHDKDDAWVGVLESLFDAGFLIESTFPVRSDSTKGQGKGAFGSKKIEYDIVHVCRKRSAETKAIYWATLRRQIVESVKSDAAILAQHKLSGLHLADLEVIIRGRVLDCFSKHYGKVKKNLAGDLMSVREILLEANSIAFTLLQKNEEDRVPDNSDSETRALFTLLREGPAIERNAASKRLKGSGISIDELIAHGWVETAKKDGQKVLQLVSPLDRWNSLTRKNQLKSDLDQVHFAINCCIGGKVYKDKPADWEGWITENYRSLMPSVGPVLKFIEGNHFGEGFREAIGIAYRTLERTLQKLRETDPEFRSAYKEINASTVTGG